MVEETAMKIIVEDMVETIVEGNAMDVVTGRDTMRIGTIQIGGKIELQFQEAGDRMIRNGGELNRGIVMPENPINGNGPTETMQR